MAKELKLEWYVYYYSHTSGKFKVFNVFRHGSYIAYVEKWLKADLTKEEFAEKLRRESMYYYWSKSEWEVIVTDTTPHISEKELQRVLKEYYLDRKVGENKPRYGRVNLADCEKIDVYDQLSLNWDEFVDYVWSFKKPPRKKREKKE